MIRDSKDIYAVRNDPKHADAPICSPIPHPSCSAMLPGITLY